MTLSFLPDCRAIALGVLSVLVVGLFGFVPMAGAQPEATLNLGKVEQVSLTGRAEFWGADLDSPLSEAMAAEYQPLTSAMVNQGISGRAFWVRTRLVNPTDAPQEWVLVHETSYLDHLEIYHQSPGEPQFTHQSLTDRAPFDSRPIDYRTLAFSASVPPHSHTDLYIKAWYEKPDSVSLQFSLYDQARFELMRARENLVFGAYYGALGVMVLISLIVGLLLQRLNAFTYGALLLVTGTKWLLLNGYGFQYLWPSSPYWHNEGFHIVYLAFAFCAFEFSKHFLDTARQFPWGHKLLLLLQVLCVAGVAFRLLGWYGPVLHLSFALLAVVALVLPVLSAMAWWRGLRYARWYFLAWLIYSISLLIVLTSAYWNVIPRGMQALTVLQLGSLLETVFLAVALTERLLNVETERRQAVSLAQEDPLTGLGNRRLLQLEYERVRHLQLQEGKHLFLIMIDLDHFKQINDRYGHDAGDKVLKEVARLLRQHCRETDVCIRYGGEEFALLIEADSTDTATVVAERIREEFAGQPTLYRGQSILHTLSCGITAVRRNGEPMSVTDMMKQADQALYEGKAAGRNCTVVARDTEWMPPLTTKAQTL